MPALTLNEAAKLAADGGETKRAGIIKLYAEKSDVLNVMMFEGIAGNAFSFTQEGDLPATAFRGVNEGFTPSAGTFNPQKVALTLAGGDLDVDRFIVKTQGEQVRSRHEELKVKALAQNVTDTIMNGDNASEPREFDGLQTLVTGTQLVANGSTSGGDALSLAKLDAAIDSVDSPTHIIMSRTLRRRFMAAVRSSTSGVGSNIVLDKNELGSPILSYAGLPILTGYPVGKNTAILPFSEANPGGGSAVGSSIYVVNFGENGVVGLSNGGIDVRDLGELDDLPVWRTRVEWYMTIAALSPYAASRLWGITDAAIAA